jgi:mannose PTS system EIIA component
MPGLFLIAHAPLASALKAVATHTFPEAVEQLEAYDVPAGSDLSAYAREAGEILARLPVGDTIVLTDVFGATPCTLARGLAEEHGLRLLVGVNVPMLWRALNYRHRPLDEVMMLAMAGATQGVMQLGASRPQNQALKPARHDSIDGHHQQ